MQLVLSMFLTMQGREPFKMLHAGPQTLVKEEFLYFIIMDKKNF